MKRISTGIKELDEVLGGGLVVGSTHIISGKPNKGKSTLVLQMAAHVAKSGRVVFASAEQSNADMGAYAFRLGIKSPNIEVLGMESDIDKIMDIVDEKKTKLLIIDSLQKVFVADSTARVGSSEQGKAVIEVVVYHCKKKGIPAIVVSQVNKEGEIAAAMAVVHDVDTALEFDPLDDDEEDPDDIYRILAVSKNRNGPSGLSAIFEKDIKTGFLSPVPKKSKLYLV